MRPIEDFELKAPTRAALSRSASTESLKLSRTSTIAALPDLPYTPPASSEISSERNPWADIGAELARRERRGSGTAGETDESEHLELLPVDKGKGAWGFVLAGFFLEVFLWGLCYSWSAILVYMQTHDPWQHSSLAALSATGSILLAMMFVWPIFVIAAFRRYPDRVKAILWVSAVINCGSMLLASWSTQVWHLVLLVGILNGISGSVLYTPVLLWLNGWWVERRGFASGCVFSGTGFGGFVLPFIIDALLNNYGFATFCRAWAGITAGVFVISLLFMKPRIPLAKPLGARPPLFTVHDFRFIRDPVCITATATTFVNSLAYMPVSLYLATFVASLASASKASLCVSMFNLAGAIASSLTGYASDRALALTLSFIGLSGAVLAITAWGLAHSLGAVFAFAMLFSATSQIPSTWGATARDVAGANPHASTMFLGWVGIFRGIASIVGPFISASLYEAHLAHDGDGTEWGKFGFRRIIVFVGVMCFVSAFGGPAVGWARRDKARRKAAAE
ncbi:hypothetical protein JCM10450v2_008388 [Rhodotorula kratochvilovae]